MIGFEEFEEQAALIPYQYRHPRFLYGLIRWLRPQNIVEVGTHLGMSAVWMARALQENGPEGHLWCIDSFCWRDQPDQERDWNLHIDCCGVRETTTLLKGRSQEVQWPQKLDFAYIDGNHTYEVCRHDFEKAFGLGATCIVLNDTATCEGVRRYAADLRCSLPKWWDFLEVVFDAGLLVALKKFEYPPCVQGNVDPWDNQ
jgi:hypothetical protein